MSSSYPVPRSRPAFTAGLRALAFLPSFLPAVALAQATSDAPPPASQDVVVKLDPFAVTSTADSNSFLQQDASSATRIAANTRDLPLPVSVMTSELIGDLMSQNAKDGAYFGAGYTGGQQNRTTFTSDAVYRNIVSGGASVGFSYSDGSALLNYTFLDEPFDFDRIEVLRGPSGVVFGSGNFGGLANKVSKQPSFTSANDIELSAGGNGFEKVAIDLTGPIPGTDQKLAFRVVSTYTSGPLSDRLDDKWTQDFVHLSLTWRPTDSTNVTINLKTRLANGETNSMGDYLEGNTIASAYRFDSNNIDPNASAPYSFHYTETMLWATITHSVGDWLFFRTLGAITQSHEHLSYVVPTNAGGYNATLTPNGTAIPLPAGMLNSVYRLIDYPGNTSGIDQDILLKYANKWIDTKTLVTFNIAGLQKDDQLTPTTNDYRQIGYISWYYKGGPIGVPAGFNPFANTAANQALQPLNWAYFDTKPSLTSSVQEFWGFWDGKINLNAGYSRNVQHGSEEDLAGTTLTRNTDNFSANVVRYGISVRPLEWASLYALSNQGFSPPTPRLNATTGQVFGPQTAQDAEGGVKLFFLKDRLAFTADYYHMDLGGVITPYPNVTTMGYYQTGGVTDKGWETSLQGEITKQWSITASVNQGDYQLANGRHVSLSSRDYGNFYTKYRFDQGLLENASVGLGMWYKMRTVDQYYNDPITGALIERDLPNANIWVASAGYHYKHFVFKVEVRNLFNRFYYLTESSGFLMRGDGRAATFTTEFHF